MDLPTHEPQLDTSSLQGPSSSTPSVKGKEKIDAWPAPPSISTPICPSEEAEIQLAISLSLDELADVPFGLDPTSVLGLTHLDPSLPPPTQPSIVFDPLLRQTLLAYLEMNPELKHLSTL